MISHNTRQAGRSAACCLLASLIIGLGTTEFDIFSIDPATCAQNWRSTRTSRGLSFCRWTEARPTVCCFAGARTDGW